MTTVFVIDDHPFLVDGVKSVFKDRSDNIKITGFAHSAKEALIKLENSSANIILLDLLMPDVSGTKLC